MSAPSPGLPEPLKNRPKTLNNHERFDVVETPGFIWGGKVGWYRVALQIGFRYEKQTKQAFLMEAVPMSDRMINDEAMDLIFREARTRNGWHDRKVTRPLLQAVYDLMKWGATSANCSPARFVFIASDEGKARLKPYLSGNNAAKTMQAPVCVLIADDMEFYENLPKLFPHADAKSWFVGNKELTEKTAFRNGTLQGAYFMIAARSLGLDCGPMSGFDNAGVDREFLAGTTWKSNFLCNIGYGTDENLFPRAPRLDFDEACRIV